MNDATLQAVTKEISDILVGQKFGKIFQISKLRLAIDFRLRNDFYLFISVEPDAPRIHLVKRRLRDLEKQSFNPAAFVQILRKRLANAILEKITKDENERVLRFSFAARDEIENLKNYTLLVQLTGRSANLFLLDGENFILDSLRETRGAGQEIAARYASPASPPEMRKDAAAAIFPRGQHESLSESLDVHFQIVEQEREFEREAKTITARLKADLQKRENLKKKLLQDLTNHGDAERWKRFGDLLLANLATAAREKNTILVIDYFDPNAPTIEIEADENKSLTEIAGQFFKRYTKARNAKIEVEKRLEILESEIENLEAKRRELEQAVGEKDIDFLRAAAGEKTENRAAAKSKRKRDETFSGARRYKSSDGFEILVGKAAKDNDYLTFRVAKSTDLWLHAADYAGSHVVVKNPNRAEIPPKSLLEAAQLAAFFSQAKSHPKAVVHYTLKKFVNKPKGAAAGLVSLSSFKTILVEPKVVLERKMEVKR